MAANTTEETNELSTLEKESKMSLEEIFKACTKKGIVETSPDKSFGFNALDDDDDDDGEDDGYNDHSFDEDEDEDDDEDEDEDENENEDNDNEEEDDDDDDDE